MERSRNASIVIVVLCAVVVPALAGLIAGGIAAPEPPPPRGETIAGRSVALFVPPTWDRVARAQPIPGLVMKDAIALVPTDGGEDAGLVAGRVTTGGRGPLPRALLRRLRSDLHTEVVGIGTWEGYRYGDLRIAGFDRQLVLYAVPTATGSTAVACYATAARRSVLRGCERIARSLEIVAGSEASLPAVSSRYGRSMSAAVGRLDARRTVQRVALKTSPGPGRGAASTRRLSRAYAATAGELAELSPPAGAEGAHAALVKRLWSSRDAYRRLATAARRKDQSDWSDARAAVRAAEARVSAALGDLGALGYGRRT